MSTLLFENIKLAIQKRTKVSGFKKSREAWLSKGYVNEPTVTFIIQSHNKSLQLEHIVGKLRGCQGAEIIVIDDGSELHHTRRLSALLTGANEFLLRSNDLYENVMYDKTIRLANGKYVALLQDDDKFDGLEWVDRAVSLLDKYPQMVILGGKNGFDVGFNPEKRHARSCGEWDHGTEFSFVPAVNRAPMWLNRQLFLDRLHHIDYRFAPFQFDDYELCLRAWCSGLLVGWYDAGFGSLSVGGMRLWNKGFMDQQVEVNARQLYDAYLDKIDHVRELVRANNATLR